jgi:hypothetical protein
MLVGSPTTRESTVSHSSPLLFRVAERALPATIALHNALQSQLGVDNRIGATFGEVYCGAVGGVKRHGMYLFRLPTESPCICPSSFANLALL